MQLNGRGHGRGRARRRVTASLVMATAAPLVLLAGCGNEPSTVADGATAGTEAPAGSGSPSAATDPTTGGSPATGGTDTVGTAYAMDPPGPRKGAEVGADMLVFDQETIPDATRTQVRSLRGVQASTTFSLAQVSLENKVYNVAAVDPAAFRLFAPKASADLQAEWDRVAGGELAVSDTLRKSLPIDKQGYLTLDVAGRQQRVHVGAYAPQPGQVDMVVNQKLGEALGMAPDNAMILATGTTSPQAMRKPVTQALGSGISVQNLDAVARYGLDPDAFQTAVFVGPFSEAVGTFHYTPAGGGRITPDPAWVASHIVTETVPILGPVTCNKYLFPQLKAALGEVVQQGLADKIHPGEYAGCYYPRFIAGTTTLSNHSFGLALDLNTPGNQRGTVGQMDRGVVAIFKRWGFAWGGDWGYTDPMHFELAHLVRPGG